MNVTFNSLLRLRLIIHWAYRSYVITFHQTLCNQTPQVRCGRSSLFCNRYEDFVLKNGKLLAKYYFRYALIPRWQRDNASSCVKKMMRKQIEADSVCVVILQEKTKNYIYHNEFNLRFFRSFVKEIKNSNHVATN